jgi:hypothetical protein
MNIPIITINMAQHWRSRVALERGASDEGEIKEGKCRGP